jgi:hypothetical protein
MSTAENLNASKKKRNLRIIFAVIAGLLAYSYFTATEKSFVSSSTPTSSSSTPTVTYDQSWVPAGFSGYPSDDNIAWRWGTSSETNCSYSSGSCWSAVIVTRDGCPSGIYAEIAILDKSGVQIDYTNDTTTRVLPKAKVKLTFDTFNEQADQARIGEISCS